MGRHTRITTGSSQGSALDRRPITPPARKRADTVAVDTGTTRCGIAVLYRHYERSSEDDQRGFNTVECFSVEYEDLANTLRDLHPRIVLAEEPAQGRLKDEALVAIALLQDVCDEIGARLRRANVSTWRAEAFGNPRVNDETVRAGTLEALLKQRVLSPREVWDEASTDRDAIKALALLACWRPVTERFARGRSPTKITANADAFLLTDKRVTGLRKSARGLYGVLFKAAREGSRPGHRVLAKAAHIAPENLREWLQRLADAGLLRVTGTKPITEIRLGRYADADQGAAEAAKEYARQQAEHQGEVKAQRERQEADRAERAAKRKHEAAKRERDRRAALTPEQRRAEMEAEFEEQEQAERARVAARELRLQVARVRKIPRTPAEDDALLTKMIAAQKTAREQGLSQDEEDAAVNKVLVEDAEARGR